MRKTVELGFLNAVFFFQQNEKKGSHLSVLHTKPMQIDTEHYRGTGKCVFLLLSPLLYL